MKKIISLIFVCAAIASNAQNNINITPMPVSLKTGKGTFILNPKSSIVLEGSGLEKTAAYLNNYLQRTFGYTLKVTKTSSPNSITLNYERLDAGFAGAYNMTVDKNGVYIAGDNETGVFYGIQTLIQLLPPGNKQAIPYVNISDQPRFAYRGMHLDVCRHFFPVDFIKKYIDYLATYKFNTFHWHLTDDQGWRIEIKKYPLLTQVGSCRDQTLIGNYGSNKYDGTKYCGYYTQEQIKEVVKYAADRYITVVPEIEMPGHGMAALTSYPYLGCNKGPYKVLQTWGISDDVFCAGNDSTYQFMENVLDEVLKLFPSEYIHVGGDECPKERWKTCPVCQKRIKDEGLKDENALQSYFVQRVEKYLNSKGRKIIGWDEILEGGLAANATVMSWRGEEGGIAAAKQDHDVVMTPGSNCYFDHSQSKNEDSLTIGGYLPLENVYNYEPIPAALNATEAKHVLGAQGNVWTEYIANTSKVEYMIFPRICALSEVLWTPKEKRSWADFERRLPLIFESLDKEKINYSHAYYDLKATVLPTPDNKGVLWKIESKSKNGFIASDAIHYTTPYLITSNKTQQACYFVDNKPISCVNQKFIFNKATGKKITLTNPPAKNYPGDGAFTLVNGVQNEKGFPRSIEFLGFLGDCEAIIDLDTTVSCSKVIVHALTRQGSWIWQPSRVTVFYSVDGINYKSQGLTEDFITTNNMNGTMTVNFNPVDARFIKVWIANEGKIPSGNPGAGNQAWLFVDEIEVE